MAKASAMTRQKFLNILGGLAIASALAALVAVSLQDRSVEPEFEPRFAFDNLESRLDEVTAFKVIAAEETFTVLPNGAGQWVIEEKGGYPAQMDSLSRLVLGLTDLELIERKTAREDWFQHLGLGEPSTGGEGTRFQILGQGGALIADLVAGMEQGLPDMNGDTFRYVRLGEDPQTYLSRGQIDLGVSVDTWADLEIFDLERARFREVRSIPAGEKARPFSATRATPDIYNFALQDIPLGFEVNSPGIANGVGSALASMTILDVAAANTIRFEDVTHLSFFTFDDIRVDLQVTEHQGAFWFRYVASDARAVAENSEETGEAEEVGASTSESADSDREKVIETLNARGAGWAFKVPDWKGDQLTQDLSSMIKVIEPGE